MHSREEETLKAFFSKWWLGDSHYIMWHILLNIWSTKTISSLRQCIQLKMCLRVNATEFDRAGHMYCMLTHVHACAKTEGQFQSAVDSWEKFFICVLCVGGGTWTQWKHWLITGLRLLPHHDKHIHTHTHTHTHTQVKSRQGSEHVLHCELSCQ